MPDETVLISKLGITRQKLQHTSVHSHTLHYCVVQSSHNKQSYPVKIKDKTKYKNRINNNVLLLRN